MKRRLLSAFLAVMMVLTMAPVAFAADTETTTEYVAQVDGNKYETLADAIEAANDGDTITLLKGGNGNGFKVPEGKFTEQGLTIDFNQFTYMIGGQLVGSAGTGTNGCQLLKNNKITFKNGSFVGATEGSKPADDTPDWHGAPAIMIQNYCDLTLENMIVTGGDETVYTFSNNCGNTVIKDSTINAGKAKGYGSGPFAFDVCRYSTYPSVSVTVQGSSVINGDVEISGTIGEGQSRQLNIEDGTFNGRFIVSNTPANISITGGKFSSDVSAYVAEGYVQNENGTVEQLGETNAVAKIDDTYYKTLADAVAAAKADEATTITLLKDVELPSYIYIKDKKNITLDLNGKNITRTGNGVFYVGNAKLRVTGTGTIFENQRDGFAPIIAKGSPDDVADYTTITIDENVTLKGDYAGIFVDTDTAGKNSYHNYGLVINMKGSIDLTAIDGGVSAYGVYVQGLNKITSGNVMQINLDGVTINTGDEAIYAAGYAKWNVKNCTFNAENAAIEVRAGDMTIDGGVYTAMASEFKCEANGNGSTTQGAALAIMQHTTKLPISVYVKNGVFHSAAAVAEKNIQKNDPKPNVDLQIADGQFNGVVVADDVLNFISGGYFTTDPSGYLAVSAETGKKYVAGAINESPYFFRVALVEDNQIPVVPAVGETAAPSAKELEKTGMTKEAAEAVAAAAKKVAAGDTEIKEAVAPIATGITDEKAAKYQQAAANDVDDVEKIEVRAYLEVKPTAYNADKAYTLDITPKYDVVVVGTKNSTTKAEKVVETNTLNVTKATEVSVQLPAGFVPNANTKLYVQHKGHEYDATVTEANGKYTATFTNPHGFSPFTISKTSQTVATIGTDKYTSFADAVSAVPANGTIEITGGTSPYTGTANKTFTVENSTSADITVNGQPIKPTESYTFKYTPSSGSSSGGSSSGKTTYKVTTSAVNNGGVNASPSNAEKGATITITLSPDKGYKLDKLTVTDGSGKSVSTVKKSDTVYTFTMPASAVTVGVSYAKADETPSKTTFNDVSANDWFASAVDYVTGKGMMNGTAANTFSPKANTTRGMLMTVLARHAGEDTTGGSVWYEKGMNWAKANGVSDGTNPQVNITREQLAAMLYRYAQNKKYDVSGAKSLDGYTDAQSVSSYAVPALQWANAAGVVNGKSGSKLDPKGYATRAEVAAMLMRFCENVEK